MSVVYYNNMRVMLLLLLSRFFEFFFNDDRNAAPFHPYAALRGVFYEFITHLLIFNTIRCMLLIIIVQFVGTNIKINITTEFTLFYNS